MNYAIKSISEFDYIEEGSGETIVLLHGLFGALSNFEHVIDRFKDRYKIVIPLLPIYTISLKRASLEGLLQYFEDFLAVKKINRFSIIGNSLGGHLALIYALKHQSNIQSLILTASSGLFENSMGSSFPRRGSYDYVKNRVQYTFYDPATAKEDYIQNVFEITTSIPKCLRIVSFAKSAQRQNLADDLPKLKVPVLLVWGLNDTITPPFVAYEFNRLLTNSTLRFIDKCCHAPMMERPEEFNEIVEEFLMHETVKA
ncbi:MAG: alpha/beta hydrolase [Cyclobacteriaceae bacterium]|nr:alpha/beta hydrolase [Cyclobacteriaceae bacterium]